jgi:hypothetical protein
MKKMILMPRILGYHPEIAIRNSSGTVSIIKMDLPDFKTHEDILRTLAQTYAVQKASELVEVLKSKIKINKYAAGTVNDDTDAIIINGVVDTHSYNDTQVISADQIIA